MKGGVTFYESQLIVFGRALKPTAIAPLHPTTQLRPTTAKAPIRRRLRKSNHAGSLSAFAHSQPDPPDTTEALLSASLRLRSLPNAKAQPTQPRIARPYNPAFAPFNSIRRSRSPRAAAQSSPKNPYSARHLPWKKSASSSLKVMRSDE